MPAVGEQPDQALAQQHRVFGDHDPHGSCRRVGPSVRPARGRGCPRRRQSRGSTGAAGGLYGEDPVDPGAGRQARQAAAGRRRAADAVVGHLDTSQFCARSTRTAARVARAYLVTLVSASDTMKYAMLSTAAGGRGRQVDVDRTGTGARAATAEIAASRPRSVRIAG